MCNVSEFWQNTLTHVPVAASTPSIARRIGIEYPSQSQTGRELAIVRYQKPKVTAAKPSQGSGDSYDTKLVDMINTAIVDRRPSVKWEDVGEILFNVLCLSYFFVIFSLYALYFYFLAMICSWSG